MGNLIIKIFNRKFILSLPSKIKFRLVRLYHEKLLFRVASNESVFTSIWRNNYWGDRESLSGPGSTLIQTEILRKEIPVLFEKYQLNVIFDAPCGDLNWMHPILENAKFKYIGGDIVGEIIDKNNSNFKKDKVDFLKFDITSNPFPDADLWLCRAILYHLSNADILKALERFIESKVNYILTSNCITSDDHINKDIQTGDYRDLNLMLPPFNFDKQVLWETNDYVPPHPPMKICLWSREQIEQVMPNIRKNI